ncbi:MAG: HEPN domain-containing protein [Bacteroidales bacterium]|nr:HEPN domain-containing protein [Bacteroidales bacterium]
MNDHEEDWTAFVRYRLEKTEETYIAAQILYEAAQWNSVVNRLYYACFYVASAILLHRHISAKSHAGIIGQFSENVVRTGDVA